MWYIMGTFYWKGMTEDTLRVYNEEVPDFLERYSNTTVGMHDGPVELSEAFSIIPDNVKFIEYPPRIEMWALPDGNLPEIYSREEIRLLIAEKAELFADFANSVGMQAVPGYSRKHRPIEDPNAVTFQFDLERYRLDEPT